MVLVYAIFMLFYSLFVIIKQHKMQKKDLLVNEVTKEEEKNLYVIMFIVLGFLIVLTGYQSFDFFNSIFNSNIEEMIEIPYFLEEYIFYGNIGLSILKIIWIPTKITKFVLQVVFGTLSVFVFFINYCLRSNKRVPKYLRNILYILSILNIVYIFVALF